MKTITIQLKNKQEEMSVETYARWLCLMEAIYIVCKKADELKIPTDKDLGWIKPISFQKYIDERKTSMLHEIQIDHGTFKGGLENSKNKIPSEDIDEVEEEVEITDEIPAEIADYVS